MQGATHEAEASASKGCPRVSDHFSSRCLMLTGNCSSQATRLAGARQRLARYARILIPSILENSLIQLLNTGDRKSCDIDCETRLVEASKVGRENRGHVLSCPIRSLGREFSFPVPVPIPYRALRTLGSEVVPIRYSSMPLAASRPSAMAHTTSD